MIHRVVDLLRRLPWWAAVLGVYAIARLLSYLTFCAVARFQVESPWGPAQPSYLEFVGAWDSDWYRTIFAEGYPSRLPDDGNGNVAQNPWAFYPLYPVLVRLLDAATGLGWQVLAPTVSLLAGAAAAIVIYRLFARRTNPATALAGVLFFATFPTAAIFQTGYAESLTILLLASALLLVARRRYWLAIPVVFLLALARPIGVPFAFFMLIHLILRIVQRRSDPYRLPEVVASWSLGVLACAAALAFPIAAWQVTGSITAYTDTEAAWSGGEISWFSGWFRMGEFLAGPVWGPVLVLAVVGAMIAAILSPAGKTMGADLQAWCFGYGFYLLMVFSPHTSTFRMVLPLFPLALALAAPQSRAYRGAVLVGYLLLQVIWIAWLWQFTPPSDYPP
ncbi:hypothetical protein LWF01_10435 [Saxibacter everestensis]|uniref:Glycosyltransferase RgtA/B/C/D-like domain-containing protein n=1 Tax=Saxibacter everestensis TaxID=2909229 RepID=A0ABY8QQ31_9MICO|nr:hypothetical protein LWF01_10435 [Brevibacteriaceae bacterium ZFBP1038]